MFIFVADIFKKDYSGGAELTSDAILQECPDQYKTFYSIEITKQLIDKHRDDFWIFGNISGVRQNLLLYAAKNLNYSVLEYDYKYCKYRSAQKHAFYEQTCNCQNEQCGKIISIFFSQAKSLWFMSQKQKEHYEKIFPFLMKNKSFVLSSVFDNETLDLLSSIEKHKNDTFLIVKSDSWIKGTQDGINYAKENNLKYILADNLPYKEMLKALASSRGLIFLPKGWDTCPRLVIEAKLLDCELIINEGVQHATEEWFSNKEGAVAYLGGRANFFWNTILGDIDVHA